MKRILIATDFSQSSKNATRYVIDLFQEIKSTCEIVLLNTYLTSKGDANSVIELNDRLKKESKELLAAEKKWALELYPQSSFLIHEITHMGSLENVIPQIIEDQKIDLVVMGKGEGNHVEQITKVLKHNKSLCPLLIIF